MYGYNILGVFLCAWTRSIYNGIIVGFSRPGSFVISEYLQFDFLICAETYCEDACSLRSSGVSLLPGKLARTIELDCQHIPTL